MKEDFFTEDEVRALGLASVGQDVRISRHAVILRPSAVSIGRHSRIDAFCLLSPGEALVIGRNVHLSAFVAVLGRGRVEVRDFATISARTSIFSSNDDYTGEYMTNPTVPDAYRGAEDAAVIIEKHAILGAGTVVLPGVRIGRSSAIGAGSLVKSDIPPSSLCAGVPARVIGKRTDGHLRLAEKLLASEDGAGSRPPSRTDRR